RTDCTTQTFDFHPLYSTASPTHVINWILLTPNVTFAMEIGHWELCADSLCNTKPDGNDADDNTCATSRGIGGCGLTPARDDDLDGISYQAKWPDGSSSHPAPIVLGAPNDNGVGPMSLAADATE